MSRDLIETGLGWSWGPDRVARSIANKDTFTLLACDRDRVVAFAIMYFGDEHAHLNLLAVLSSHQRLGIGQRMVVGLTDSACAAIIHDPRAARQATRRAASTGRSVSPKSAYILATTAGRKWPCALCGC
jgi:GNAT superfamily N-acetyltransferase